MAEQEKPTVRYIPENYTIGINIAGMHFSTRKFFEGIGLGIILAILSFFTIRQAQFIDSGTMIGFVISFGLMGLVLGIIGINDEPVSIFLSNWFRYRRKRRSAFYNPHIKTRDEDIKVPYVYIYEDEKESLPKEKLNAFLRKYKSELEKKEMQKMVEFQKTNTYDETTMFFKDDEGYFEKPVEYMNESEYKKYQKKLRKIARRKKKEEKRQAKLEARQRKREEREARKASGRRFFW